MVIFVYFGYPLEAVSMVLLLKKPNMFLTLPLTSSLISASV